MSGIAGRSGRKGFYHELDIKTLLNKSYSIVMSYFNDANIPAHKKVGFASAFLQKRVGEKIDLSIEHTFNPDQIEKLKRRIVEIKQLEITDGK